MSKQPIKVLVTGAAGQIGYALLYGICNGDMFGPAQSVQLNMLDIPPLMQALKAIELELEDCAFPLLKKTIATDDLKTAFEDIDLAIMVGAMPRREGMQRSDLLQANVKIFRDQGRALEQYAKRTVKVLVVGNPANTNCFVMAHYAPSIPRENFSALTRLDHNRARSQIAMRLGLSVTAVSRCIIWGNHSNTQFPDIEHGQVCGLDGQQVSVRQAVADDHYLNNEFISVVQTRGAAIIKARKASSAMSAANAITNHVHDWFNGSEEWVSMAISSDGSYGIEKGLIYSFPVTISNGTPKIVQGLNITDFAREKMDASAKELNEEKEIALSCCNESS